MRPEEWRWAMREGMTPFQFLVWHMVRSMEEEEIESMTQGDFANRMGVSRRTIERNVQALRRVGFSHWNQRGRRRKTDVTVETREESDTS